jgi:hypothetical protein
MITLATLKNVGWATTPQALHLSHLSAAEQEGSSQEKMIMKLTKKLTSNKIRQLVKKYFRSQNKNILDFKILNIQMA